MSYLTDPEFLISLSISALGLSLMSWWLFTRIMEKLREVEERNNRGTTFTRIEEE